MNKKSIFILFICLAIIQFAIPVSMILRHESTLKNGRQFKFHTKPVDPYDAFRGRFVALRFEQDNVKVPDITKFKSLQKVYALLENDTSGFAKIDKLTLTEPSGNSYIKVTIKYKNSTKSLAYIAYPFDRYYMEEKKAPEAEKIYRKHSRKDAKEKAYVTVRVKDGTAVIEELFVEGQPISEFFK